MFWEQKWIGGHQVIFSFPLRTGVKLGGGGHAGLGLKDLCSSSLACTDSLHLADRQVEILSREKKHLNVACLSVMV